MPIDASILNEVEHLRDLGAQEKLGLAEKIDLLRYAAGDVIFSYGDPGHALYIVRSGEVEIFVKNDQGEKIVLEISRPGELVVVVETPGYGSPVKSPPGSCVGIESFSKRPNTLNFGLKIWSIRTIS